MGSVRVQTAAVALAASVWLVAGCGDGGTRRAPTEFQANPQTLDFGATALGGTATLPIHLENGGRTAVDVTSIVSNTPAVQVSGAPFSLEAGQGKDVSVVFQPTTAGNLTGSVVLKTNATGAGQSGMVTVQVVGVGVQGALVVKTSALDFGDVQLQSTQSLNVEIDNPSTVPVGFHFAFVGPDSDEFTQSGAADAQVTAGQSSQVAVTFQPLRLGLAQASVEITPGCQGCAKVTVPIRGVGIASSVEIDPLRLDFGTVAPGTTSQQTITVTNLGNEPLDFNGLQFLQNDGSFAAAVDGTFTSPLQPGAQFQIIVSYNPSANGSQNQAVLQIGINAADVQGSGPKIPLSGQGGASCVDVFPKTIDFGTVAFGMSATQSVSVINRCGVDLQADAPDVTSTNGGFFSVAQPSGSFVIPTGGVAPVSVTFTPKPNTPTSAGSLGLRVTAGPTTTSVAVPLTGTAKSFPPCQYTIAPAALDFGTVPLNATAQLGIALTNTGQDQCFVAGMDLAAGSDPSFAANPVPSAVVDPGGRVFLPVEFRPTTPGSFSAMAEAWVNSSTAGHPTVMITGNSTQSCFELQPAAIDFGLNKVSCGMRSRSIVAYDNCTAPVTLDSMSISEGTSTVFSLDPSGPTLPLTLQPGTSAVFSVDYQPVTDGRDAAELQALAGGVTYGASITGSATTGQTQTDQFVQASPTKVDVLIVMDNSGSIGAVQQELSQHIGVLVTQAQQLGLDYHIAVTTTGVIPATGGWTQCPGGAQGGEAGRFFPVDNSNPRIITPTTPNGQQVLSQDVLVGACHWWEEAFQAAYLALTPPLVDHADDPNTPQPNDGNLGFYRQDAKLSILFIEDDDDESTPPVSFYETLYRGLKNNDPSMVTVSAIAGPLDISNCPQASAPAPRYYQMVQDMGGVFEPICTPDWDNTFKIFGDTAFGARRFFPLSMTPSDATQITVTVNGQPATGWTYDSANNQVVFDPASVPAADSVIDVTYPIGC